jgi:bisphosphoglycerate-independent phosphoglycerate mutase (AlkP superfamily)
MTKGPSIRKNFYVGEINTVDIAPTILHLLSVPIPKYMDGKILKITKNTPKR